MFAWASSAGAAAGGGIPAVSRAAYGIYRLRDPSGMQDRGRTKYAVTSGRLCL